MKMTKKTNATWFGRQKLNTKFTVVIGGLLFIPLFALLLLIFNVQKDNLIKQSMTSLRYNMTKEVSEVQKTVDLCNTSTQVFLGYRNLSDYLLTLKKGQDLPTIDLVNFYNDDIGMLQKMVNANPYLYQIRVYASGDDVYEMMPILFDKKRLMGYTWATTYESGKWVFDYKDEVFGESVSPSNHTMGLITTMTDYEYGEIGVMEVAVRMDDVFETMFDNTDAEYTGLIDEYGLIYSGTVTSSIWEDRKAEIILAISRAYDEETYIEAEFLDRPVVIGVVPIKELNAKLIRVVNLEAEYASINRLRSVYTLILILVFVVLILVVNWIVQLMLKRFYVVLGTIEKIQEGNLNARVGTTESDEMGLLGNQIDKMLETIDRLLKENINRELLRKNSEIKALQNQINAHFIYNVLESIKMMAEIDEKYAISDAVTSLGKLLRYGMKWTSHNVTVGQELDYIKHYLELANLRFDYQITLSLSIPRWAYTQQIPKISLQPIVENAIIHGIEDLAEDASIYIKAFLEDEDFIIEITDSGVGMSQASLEAIRLKIEGALETGEGSGHGIGLKNVQDRIRISFGDKYGLSVLSKESCYTKVVVRLPITDREAFKDA